MLALVFPKRHKKQPLQFCVFKTIKQLRMIQYRGGASVPRRPVFLMQLLKGPVFLKLQGTGPISPTVPLSQPGSELITQAYSEILHIIIE